MELPGQGESFQRKYKLHEVLGKGGFAAVYRATDVEIGRDVAIKVLAPSDDGYSKGIESRFMREARVIAGLQDPHTITMFEFGRSDSGLLYMVFEYVRGIDLSVLIRRSPLAEPAVVHIVHQVLQSLREAHVAGVLHRDLKPANILIYEYMDDPYRAKLLDFGIAKPVAGDGVDITSDGAMIGTPRYMAPEQIYAGELSPASDIYSLGLVAYEMLVGSPAISGRTTKEMMVQQLSDAPVQLPPSLAVSPQLRNVVNRMTTRDPASRFPTADQAIQALEFVRSSTSGPQGGLPYSGPNPAWSSGAHLAPGQPLPPNTPTPRSGGHPALPGTPGGNLGAGPHASGVHPTWTHRQSRAVAGVSTQQERPAPASRLSIWPLVLGGLAVGAAIFGAVLWWERASEDTVAPVVSTQRSTTLVWQTTTLGDDASPSNATVSTDDGGADSPDSGADASGDAGAASLAGCGLKAGWEGTSEFRLTHTGGRRQWTVYLPKSYDENVKHPVVMLFHKGFNNKDSLIKDSNIRPVADKGKFVVMSFDAKESMTPWIDNDVEFVERALDETAKAACIDRGRIFAAGHGGGGDFTRALACVLPLAGISTVGSAESRGGRSCAPSPPVPFFRTMGLADNYIPPKGGGGCIGGNYMSIEEIEHDWRQNNECVGERSRWITRRRDTCWTWECEAPFVSCHLEGGHDWPDSTPEKFEMPGCPHPPPKFPITEMMWKFFAEQESVDPTRW